MKTCHPCSLRARAQLFTTAIALSLAGATSSSIAQSAPAATPLRPVANVAKSAVKPGDEVVELSPFAVVADTTDSYQALNTNSVTRFSAELSKLPVSADVFTETFMDDVAAISLEEMVANYGTGTGFGGSNPESAADANRPGDRASNVNIKIRGLDAGQMRINSFGQGGVDDAFTTERVDVVRGPQSLLNGGVGGGGVVNAISKQARFNSKLTRLQFRTDDNGSRRGVLDYGIGGKRVPVYTKEYQPLADGWRVKATHPAWTPTAEGIESAWTQGHNPVLFYEGNFQDVVVEVEFRFRREPGKNAYLRVGPANRDLDPRAYTVAIAQPVGTRAIEILGFNDPAAARRGPIALQMHNARLFDEYKDLRIEVDPAEPDKLILLD